MTDGYRFACKIHDISCTIDHDEYYVPEEQGYLPRTIGYLKCKVVCLDEEHGNISTNDLGNDIYSIEISHPQSIHLSVDKSESGKYKLTMIFIPGKYSISKIKRYGKPSGYDLIIQKIEE